MTREDRRRRGQVPMEAGRDPPFQCENCTRVVPGTAPGTRHRNHCPYCLHALHVDIRTGDRRSGCRGLMEPIAVWVKRDGEWSILHRCRQCGKLTANRIAGDDNEVALMSLALRPLAQPPFPLHELAVTNTTGPTRPG